MRREFSRRTPAAMYQASFDTFVAPMADVYAVAPCAPLGKDNPIVAHSNCLQHSEGLALVIRSGPAGGAILGLGIAILSSPFVHERVSFAVWHKLGRQSVSGRGLGSPRSPQNRGMVSGKPCIRSLGSGSCLQEYVR